MSKIIVEMDMPKDCLWYEDGKEGRCPFLDDGDCCRGQSDEANEVAETWSDLQKGCPIKGILPDEHGRLVDADACSSVLRKLENEAKTNTEKLCYGYAARMFEEAFTIIAAELAADGTVLFKRSET